MKKLFFLLILIILTFGVVSAAEVELKKEFVKGETLIAKISGNFVKQPMKDNMRFYRRHMSTSMGIYDMIKIDGDYYVYVNIPLEKETDNYSLVISGVEYYSGTKIVDDDLVANFTILDEQASFSISPVLFVAEEDYIIKLQNLIDTKIDVAYEKVTEEEVVQSNEKLGFFESLFGGFKEQPVGENTSGNMVSLKSGEIVEVKIQIGNYVGFEKVEFSYGNETYNSLVYIYGRETENVTEIVNETVGKENDTNVEENVTVIVNETVNEEKNVEEPKACDEYGGVVCSDDEICDGETEYSSTAICCLGECVKVKKSNTGKTVGWIIIIALALFLTWFFKKKYRGAKPAPIDLEKESKEKK